MRKKLPRKSSTRQPSLSIIVHTKNEEDLIEDCLCSCGPIAKEIIVVDMQSTDSTRQKALAFGATVVTVVDVGYVEPARQKAIELASSDWVLILDADERLTLALRSFIQKYLSQPTHSVVKFPRKNIVFGKWLQHGLMWPDYQVRLFRKGALIWPDEIHSQPILPEDTLALRPTLQNAILHVHTTSLQQRLRKIEKQAFNENIYTSKQQLSSYEVMEQLSSEFPRRFIQNEGYKDGVRGFIHAKLMEYYQFLAFARHSEESGFKEFFSPDEVESLWDTSKQIGFLLEENRRLRDAKIYKFYNFFKRLLTL